MSQSSQTLNMMTLNITKLLQDLHLQQDFKEAYI